jgi:hypothetical protein
VIEMEDLFQLRAHSALCAVNNPSLRTRCDADATNATAASTTSASITPDSTRFSFKGWAANATPCTSWLVNVAMSTVTVWPRCSFSDHRTRVSSTTATPALPRSAPVLGSNTREAIATSATNDCSTAVKHMRESEAASEPTSATSIPLVGTAEEGANFHRVLFAVHGSTVR